MTAYDALADDYDAGRLGYSNDLYNALLAFGLSQRHHVLDVCCGTGLASRPLIENGFRVTGVDVSEPMLEKARARFASATWVQGSALALPFGDAAFDAAISAQAFHHLDRRTAIAELARVVRPGGIVAIWWKLMTSDDPVKMARDEVARSLGAELPPSGLPGGFKEFYGSALVDPVLRVVPWQATVRLAEFLRYERSRQNARETFGESAERYYRALEERLQNDAGQQNPLVSIGYVQFVYLARTPA